MRRRSVVRTNGQRRRFNVVLTTRMLVSCALDERGLNKFLESLYLLAALDLNAILGVKSCMVCQSYFRFYIWSFWAY